MSYKLGDGGESFRPFQEWLNRKFASYSNIKIDLKYGLDEARVVAEAMRRYNMGLAPSVMTVKLSGVDTRVEGAIATDAFLQRAGFHLPVVNKYRIQGVGGDSNAFLNPPTAHSFNKATDGFAWEGQRLTQTIIGPIIPIGYSMGGVSVCKYLRTLTPQQQDQIAMVLTFGDPSTPAQGSLFGDTPGEGISKLPQPQWCWNRYYSFALPGDWYPEARGLLFLLYEVLTRAELTLEFAQYLFLQFPIRAMQELMGIAPSSDPLAGVLGPLAGMLTTGPTNVVGSLLGPLQILGVLPEIVELLIDALQFMITQAHGMYDDPDHAAWDGMTGVNKAVSLVREHVPQGATLLLFPGTWSQWNQLFQFDVAIRLQ
jgi:hypothetical protein